MSPPSAHPDPAESELPEFLKRADPAFLHPTPRSRIRAALGMGREPRDPPAGTAEAEWLGHVLAGRIAGQAGDKARQS